MSIRMSAQLGRESTKFPFRLCESNSQYGISGHYFESAPSLTDAVEVTLVVLSRYRLAAKTNYCEEDAKPREAQQ